MRILWGLIFMAAGSLVVIKSEWFLNNLGRLAVFEEKLGSSGGSRLGYKLIGLFVLFVGILMVTNTVDGIVEWLAGFFLPGGNIK